LQYAHPVEAILLLLRHRITVVAQLAELERSLAAIDHEISLYSEKVAPS